MYTHCACVAEGRHVHADINVVMTNGLICMDAHRTLNENYVII